MKDKGGEVECRERHIKSGGDISDINEEQPPSGYVLELLITLSSDHVTTWRCGLKVWRWQPLSAVAQLRESSVRGFIGLKNMRVLFLGHEQSHQLDMSPA